MTRTQIKALKNPECFINYDINNSTAEVRFKNCVVNLLGQGIYPSPQAINEKLRGHSGRNINGRECQWRREICKVVGFTLRGSNL